MEIQNDGIRDAKERKAALDCTHSYIVQAPAGSGKTSLLIHRLLKLLAKVDKPEEILAITFTRKAAEEMRSRVVEALVSAKYDPEPEKDYEKETWQYAKEALKRDEEKGWNLLQSQGRLHLKTIDSFCSDLIRRLPTGSHFGAPLAVEPDITPLLQEAVRSLLSAVDSAAGTEDAKFKPYVDAYRNLLEWYKNNRRKLINDMVRSLEERALWRHSSQQLLLPLATAPTDVIQKHKNELNRQLTTAVRLFIIAHLRDLHDHLSQSELPSEMAEFMAYAWKNLNCDKYKDKPLAQDLLYCKNDRQSFDRPDELSTKDLPYYRAIKSLIFTNKGEIRDKKSITITIGFPSNNKEEKDKKESYKEFLGKLRDPNAEERLKDPALQQAFEVAASAFEFPNDSVADAAAYPYTDGQLQYLGNCALLMELACHFMREVFRSHRACDFTEIALNSLEALTQDGEHNELSLQLDSQIKHILFDEYQDTSSSQLELLERLTANWQRVDNDPGAEHEGRTVFIVGDPMQSIYRFRAAEVGIFMRTRDKGLTTIKPIYEELKCNFRSNKLLIGSFNTLFGGNQNDYEKWQASGDGIFPAKDGLNESAITYKLADTPTGDFKNPDKRTAAVSDPALVPIYEHVVPHPAGKDSNELEAEKVLELVQEFYRHLAESANKSDSEDPVEPQDATKKVKEKIPTIAILLRSRTGATPIISKLRQNNIPYQAHDIELLSSSAVVKDLTVLTRALLHLGDDIAWLALLRSPLLGLNDKEITCLLEADAQRPNADGNNGSTTRRTATIWKILNRVDFSQPTWKDLDTDDLKTRCDHFRDAMRQALQMRGVQPLCSWVRGTWLSLGGPRTLTAIQEQGLVREYFAMLQELEGDDLPDAEEIQRRIAKHYAVPNTYAEGKNPVQIMTIHGAKGLEFDTVIIPFLNRESNTGDNGLVRCHYMYGEANDANPETVFYCPSAPKEKEKEQNIPSLLVKKINADCELNERRRLLYVAATRAKSVLHFVTIEIPEKPASSSMLNLLQEQLNEVKNPNTQQDNADKSPNQEDPSRNLPDIMPSVARLKLDILTGWKVEPGLQPEVHPNHEYDDKSAYGIALHLLCQYIGERNEDLQDNVEAYSDFIALGVAEYSKNNPDGKPDDLARLPHKLETGLQGLLSDPYGRWSLEHHTDSHCEQDVCIIDEGLAKEYRLDRIFTYAGQYWIVDYKTGDPSNADHYHEKMKLYAKLIATTKNIQTINLALVYVDSDNPRVQLFCAQYDSRTGQAIWDNKFMPKL